jgi:DNA polymerase (family 10)
MARDAGVMLSIGTDAHSTDQLRFMRHGIGQARRGWVTAEDVLNTRPLSELRKLVTR